MATIVIEDGTQVAGANSYATEAELSTYATDRGVTISGTAAQLLIRAMDYVEDLEFIGIRRNDDSTQPLQWPRVDVVVDTYRVSNDTIPDLLKDGQIETALAIDNSQDPLADIPRVKLKSSVGPISVEYSAGQSTTIVRKLNAKLRKLLKNGGGTGNFPVTRGNS